MRPRATLVFGTLILLFSAACDGMGLRNRSDAVSTSTNTSETSSSRSSRSERVAELLAASIRPGSNFTRGPTASLLVRLQALFGTTAIPSYFLDPTVTSSVVGSALGAADSYSNSFKDTRSSSTLSIAALRAQLTKSAGTSSNLCYGITSSHALFSTTTALMDGESVPSDSTTATAWAAARNGWLYPYASDSEEVSTLKTLFSQSQADTAGAGYQDLCTAILLAPQFWLGNIGPYDVVRKITLELGGQIPSFRNHFGPYIAGTKTLASIVEEMQAASATQTDPSLAAALQYNTGCYSRGTLSTSCTYSPYLDLVKSWHRDWLGLTDFYKSDQFDPMERYPEYGAQYGATGVGGQSFHLLYYSGSTAGSDSRALGLAGQWVLHPDATSFTYENYNGTVKDAEWCDASSSSSLGQTFNANTTRLLLEFSSDGGTTWTPLNEWERQSSATPCTARSSSVYGDTYGAFTDSEGNCWIELTQSSSKSASAGTDLRPLSKIGVPQRNTSTTSSAKTGSDGAKYAYPFEFQKLGTPSTGSYPALGEFYMSVLNTGRRDLRIRRFATDTSLVESEQNGFSQIKLWWTDTPVYVCNNLSRILATCSYRPDTSGLPLTWDYNKGTRCQALDGTYPDFAIQEKGSEVCPSAASSTAILSLRNIVKGEVSLLHLLNPKVLTAFSCGVHSPSGSTETTRYPKTSPYQDVAINARLTKVPYRTSAEMRAVSSTRDNSGRPIEGAIDSVQADLANEPIHLIENVIQSNGDYRELLTADYTWARGPYELFLRTGGGLPLPIRPPDFTRTASNWLTLQKIYPMTFSALDSDTLTYSTGIAASGAPFTTSYFSGKHLFQDPYTYLTTAQFTESLLDQSGGKPTSGILTQPAFVAQAGGKVRTLANHIFTKLTCKDIHYPIVSTTDATHVSLIPTGEMTTGAHLDPTSSCVGCHINLDPLASALSSGFHEKGEDYTSGLTTYTLSSAHRETSSSYSARTESISLLASGGETFYHETYGTRGIRGNGASSSRSTGALFGESVTGVREVGEALAKSDLFARCAVQKTFEGLFGRTPDESADQQLIDRVTEKFKGEFGYNYNSMVKELATSSEFAERK